MTTPAGTVPSPPSPFAPHVETVPAGTVLYRVHEPVLPAGVINDGTVMNPGYGKPTRFAFFGDPVVPVLYAADSPEAAVHESILHDAQPGTFIPRAQWEHKVLTVLRCAQDLSLVSFRDDGLRVFGLSASNLTDTDRATYPSTVRWALAAWHAGGQGVSYMCRHRGSSMAVALFGDKVPPGSLVPVPGHPHARAFSLPGDAEWLAAIAWGMHAVLRF